MNEWLREKEEALREERNREREEMERVERLKMEERGEVVVANSVEENVIGGVLVDEDSMEGEQVIIEVEEVEEEDNMEEEDEGLLAMIEEIPLIQEQVYRDEQGESRDEQGESVDVTRQATSGLANAIPAPSPRECDETTPLLLQPTENRKRKRDGGSGILAEAQRVLYSPVALFIDVCFGIDEEG